jgi:hypothetical protein
MASVCCDGRIPPQSTHQHAPRRNTVALRNRPPVGIVRRSEQPDFCRPRSLDGLAYPRRNRAKEGQISRSHQRWEERAYGRVTTSGRCLAVARFLLGSQPRVSTSLKALVATFDWGSWWVRWLYEHPTAMWGRKVGARSQTRESPVRGQTDGRRTETGTCPRQSQPR